MHKFIRSNKNPNTHVFVCEYNWPIEERLKGRALVIKINNLDDILNIQKHLDETTKLDAFVYKNEYASLETIDINPNWGNTPVILYINRLGQFRNIHEKVELLKRLNVIVIFTGIGCQACKDAQILSSLGIHSGIELTPNSELSDSILDLMTYAFYGTMPHAEIEPFSTIEKYYDGESYVSPALAEFINPERYIHIDKDLNLAFSDMDLKNGAYLPEKYPYLKTEQFAESAEKEALKWQDWFVDSHDCTFCPAFRVCMGYFCNSENRVNGRCKEVMTELLESIEFHKSRLQQVNKKKCQL